MRRILIIILIVALIGGSVLIFRGINKKNSGEAPEVSQRTFRSIFGIGKNNSTSQEDTSAGDVTADIPELPRDSKFKVVSPSAVAGYTVFDVKKKITIPPLAPGFKPTVEEVTEHVVRYVGRANGYVYEIKDGGVPTQISNIFIPNVYEASFATPNDALIRFLRDDERTIATYHIPVPGENPDGTRTQAPGTYLQDHIKNFVVSPDGKTIAQVVPENGLASISTVDLLGKNKKELLKSSFHSWIISWPGQQVYLQTKASFVAAGFLYRIDIVNKRLLRVLGDIRGLTTRISPTGRYILYSESAREGFQSKLLDTKIGTTRLLSASILPEKCTWPKDETLFCAGNEYIAPGTYPDDWYAGITLFDDKLYRIIPSVGVIDTIDTGEEWSYDATNLFIDEVRRLLYFTDKRTGILWQFEY